MAQELKDNNIDRLSRYNHVLFSVAIIGIILILLIPLPTFLLDFLLACSISLSIVILLTVLFINTALEFNTFPTILLIVSLFRLSLNIASTRLILSDGHKGVDAAGRVINAFGDVVMSGSIIIGIIIFSILTIINFVVITKGAGRIAEVAARFSLDAMPGKQMAIDADLSAGLISEEVAKKRRSDLEKESTFFGAMDGANKFVRGDAIAGILITFINFIAGILIGVLGKDMVLADAVNKYTILTIGDGLISQIPSLIVSIAAGLLVTKAGIIGTTDKVVLEQLGRNHLTFTIVAGLLLFLGILPTVPLAPFWFIATLLGILTYYIRDYQNQSQNNKTPDKEEEQLNTEEELNGLLSIENIKLEIGSGLLSLIKNSDAITKQIKNIRKQLAHKLGFVIPSVRIQDNMDIQSTEYIIKIKDTECGRGVIQPNMLLVIDPQGQNISIPGEDTKDPTFGIDAKWIDNSYRENALNAGYTIIEPSTVITTHISELVKENVIDLLSYSKVQKMLDKMPEEHAKLVSDLVPKEISVSVIQKVLHNLLSENVSIRDLPYILESIMEIVGTTTNPLPLTEHVRTKLSKQICLSHVNDNMELAILTLSQKWEDIMQENIHSNDDSVQLILSPNTISELINEVQNMVNQHIKQHNNVVLVVSADTRPHLRAVLARFNILVPVLSSTEIYNKINIINLGEI